MTRYLPCAVLTSTAECRRSVRYGPARGEFMIQSDYYYLHDVIMYEQCLQAPDSSCHPPSLPLTGRQAGGWASFSHAPVLVLTFLPCVGDQCCENRCYESRSMYTHTLSHTQTHAGLLILTAFHKHDSDPTTFCLLEVALPL